MDAHFYHSSLGKHNQKIKIIESRTYNRNTNLEYLVKKFLNSAQLRFTSIKLIRSMCNREVVYIILYGTDYLSDERLERARN